MNHNPHTQYPYNFDSKIRKSVKPIYDNIKEHDAVIVLTEGQKKDIELRYGKLNNCFVIPHSFSGGKRDTDFNKRDLKRVVSIARFEEQKQNDHLVRAFEKVVKVIPDAYLEMYGFGENQEMVQKLINELNLQNNVFIKGFTNDVPGVFKTSAMKMMSSKYEGQGLVILESLSNGCPVVSYRTKYGPEDMIVDGKNGYLVEYNNIDMLAEKTIELLKNPAKIKEFSSNGYESLADFTDEIFMERWIDLFDKLVKRKREKDIVKGCKYVVNKKKWSYFNENYKINTLTEDSDIINKSDIIYRLKHRKNEKTIDLVPKINKRLLKSQKDIQLNVNLNELLEHNNFQEGFWDVYLVVYYEGMNIEVRLGKDYAGENKKADRIKEIKKHTVKPYFTKYGNFSFEIRNKA